MISLLGGVFLGWSLGANHAANCFGSAVASRMVRFWTAAGLCAAGVVLGALLEGQAGIETLSGLTSIDLEQAVAITVAVALTVTAMTWFNLPVSTSQGVVGAILGIGFLNQQINLAGLEKVVVCWVGTPFCALAAACALYKVLASIYNRLRISIFQADILLRVGLIAAGCYASYTLGANNVANATAVFVGAGTLTIFQAALIGGLSIALGVLTYWVTNQKPATGWVVTAAKPLISARTRCSSQITRNAPWFASSPARGCAPVKPDRADSSSLIFGLCFMVHDPSG
jgi:PiT family inorganic phosphate transporter